MIIERIKPVESGLVRLTVDFSITDFTLATSFDPNSSKIFNEESNTPVFQITMDGKGTVGKYGLDIVPISVEDKTAKIVSMIQFGDEDEAEILGLLAHIASHLGNVEKQITDAVKNLAEFSDEIKEV